MVKRPFTIIFACSVVGVTICVVAVPVVGIFKIEYAEGLRRQPFERLLPGEGDSVLTKCGVAIVGGGIVDTHKIVFLG
jgi:hypothetical protein